MNTQTNPTLQTNPTPAPCTNVVQPPSQTTPPLLADAASQFLEAKAPNVSKPYLTCLKWSIGKLVSVSGNPTIDQVTAAMIQHSFAAPDLEPGSKKTMLECIKTFFHWNALEGYLPAGVPTAADLVTVNVSRNPPGPEVIVPGSLQRVIIAARQVELRLALALWSFAGLGNADLKRLHWEDFSPGRAILMKPAEGTFLAVSRKIRPVLDAWVSPFYGSKGPVVSSDWLHLRLYHLARKLRVICHPQILNRSYRVYVRALAGVGQKGGPQLQIGPHIPHGTILTDAHEFFSLTPTRVGIPNWPEMVARYLDGIAGYTAAHK